MFELGVTLLAIVITAATIKPWLYAGDQPTIDPGSVSDSWLSEHKARGHSD